MSTHTIIAVESLDGGYIEVYRQEQWADGSVVLYSDLLNKRPSGWKREKTEMIWQFGRPSD